MGGNPLVSTAKCWAIPETQVGFRDKGRRAGNLGRYRNSPSPHPAAAFTCAPRDAQRIPPRPRITGYGDERKKGGGEQLQCPPVGEWL